MEGREGQKDEKVTMRVKKKGRKTTMKKTGKKGKGRKEAIRWIREERTEERKAKGKETLMMVEL